MKFSDYLFNPAIRVISVLLGILVGGGTALFTGWTVGAFVGAVTVLVSAFVYPTVAYVRDLPYIRIKRKLPQPFLFDVRVSIVVKNGVVEGFFILTDSSMYFLAINEETHSLELSREDVKAVRKGENYSLHIFLNDTQLIRVRTPACEEIFKILAEKGWC